MRSPVSLRWGSFTLKTGQKQMRSEKRPKTGGRTAETPNRGTATIEEKLAALGCDPIEGMAQIAMDPSTDVSLKAQMFKELAQYVAPKRKSIEMRGSDAGPTLEALIIRSYELAGERDRTRAVEAPKLIQGN